MDTKGPRGTSYPSVLYQACQLMGKGANAGESAAVRLADTKQVLASSSSLAAVSKPAVVPDTLYVYKEPNPELRLRVSDHFSSLLLSADYLNTGIELLLYSSLTYVSLSWCPRVAACAAAPPLF